MKIKILKMKIKILNFEHNKEKVWNERLTIPALQNKYNINYLLKINLLMRK